MLGVSEKTLRRWVQLLKIKAVRPTPTAHRRYDVDDFLARHSNIGNKPEPKG